MTRHARTIAADQSDARNRARTASAYLEVAHTVLDDERRGMPGVAVGNAVLAGIAAADAICAARLGQIHRGNDHRSASRLLAKATPDGDQLAAHFRRLIDLKDEAHYGVTTMSATKARDAVRWASLLVSRAETEILR